MYRTAIYTRFNVCMEDDLVITHRKRTEIVNSDITEAACRYSRDAA